MDTSQRFKNRQCLLLVEYVERMNLINEPAFLWWVHHMLRKSARLLLKIKTVFHKNNLQFGIMVPRNYADAKKMDRGN